MYLVVMDSEFLLHVYKFFCILYTLAFCDHFVGHLVSRIIEHFAWLCFTCIFYIALIFILQL